MMICSNGPSLDQKEVVEKFLLAVVARFKAFKKRVPNADARRGRLPTEDMDGGGGKERGSSNSI
jgi:hypothetical protein